MKRIVARVAAKRRGWLLVVAATTAALIGVVAVAAGLASPDPDAETVAPTKTRSAPGVPLFAHAGPYGFLVEMTLSFPDNRQLLSGVYETGGKTFPVSFYNDSTDDGPEPHPFPLAAGVPVTSSVHLTPDCAGPARPPELVVTSRLTDGSTREDTFSAAAAKTFAKEQKKWCATGVQASVSRSHGAAPGDPAGNVRVTLTIVNPGTKPVTVTSDAYDIGRAHWNPATVTVPPASERELVITATHSSCGARETPWRAGHLKSNRRPISVTNGSEWC
jgi:hypothetical protein